MAEGAAAPSVPTGRSATAQGRQYQLQYSYNATTSYVAGEFYWRVERGQQTVNRDFAAGSARPAAGGQRLVREGRLAFVHADWSGYSIFEEAFSRGHWAGAAAPGRLPKA